MKVWLRRGGKLLGGILVILLLLLVGAYILSGARLGPVEGTAHPIRAADVDLAEGQRLAGAYGCTGCHGERLQGAMLIDAKAFVRLPAGNLTDGRRGGRATDEQWELAVRHGIGFDGRPLFIMPSPEYAQMSDLDLARIMTFARSLDAVADTLPERAFGPVGRMLIALGRIPFAPDLIPADIVHLDPTPAATPEYGFYLTRMCIGCHGADLHGGPPEQREPPVGPDLSRAGALASWAEADFVRALRTGQTPDGRTLDSNIMPWTALGRMNDTELSAIWAYLQTLEAS